MRAADSAREAGRFDEAARFYAQIVGQKGEPTTVAKARLGLAQSLGQSGKTDQALQVLDELLASRPSPDLTIRAHFAAAEALEKAGRAEEAVKAYQATLVQEPHPEVAAPCLLRVGALQSQLKQYGPSAEALNRLLKQYPKSALVPEALYELGWGFLEQKPAGRYRQAVAAPSGKELADKAWYKLGWCYREMKDYSHAAEAFLKVPADYPRSDLAPESRLRAGEALLSENRPKEALAEFTRLIEENRGKPGTRGTQVSADLDPRAQLGAGECRLKLGEVDAGIAILRQVAVTTNGPLGAEAQAQIGDSFFARGGYKAALEEYLRVTMLFHTSSQAPYAQYRIGETYLKLGDTPSASGAFHKVIDGWGNTPWADKARQRLNGGR